MNLKLLFCYVLLFERMIISDVIRVKNSQIILSIFLKKQQKIYDAVTLVS